MLTHNVWSKGLWPLVVTLTGWAMLMRGVMNFFLPPDVMAELMAGARVVDFYYLYAAIPLVLGAYLSLRGFSATAPPLFDGAGFLTRRLRPYPDPPRRSCPRPAISTRPRRRR